MRVCQFRHPGTCNFSGVSVADKGLVVKGFDGISRPLKSPGKRVNMKLKIPVLNHPMRSKHGGICLEANVFTRPVTFFAFRGTRGPDPCLSGGGVVTARTHIGEGFGYYAYFADPEGNVIGLWSQH